MVEVFVYCALKERQIKKLVYFAGSSHVVLQCHEIVFRTVLGDLFWVTHDQCKYVIVIAKWDAFLKCSSSNLHSNLWDMCFRENVCFLEF